MVKPCGSFSFSLVRSFSDKTKYIPYLIHLYGGTGIVDEQRKGQEETQSHTSPPSPHTLSRRSARSLGWSSVTHITEKKKYALNYSASWVAKSDIVLKMNHDVGTRHGMQRTTNILSLLPESVRYLSLKTKSVMLKTKRKHRQKEITRRYEKKRRERENEKHVWIYYPVVIY